MCMCGTTSIIDVAYIKGVAFIKRVKKTNDVRNTDFIEVLDKVLTRFCQHCIVDGMLSLENVGNVQSSWPAVSTRPSIYVVQV
jgi:hypothetical protein